MTAVGPVAAIRRFVSLTFIALLLAAAITTVSTGADLKWGDMRVAEAASDCTDQGSYRFVCVKVTAYRLDEDSWNATISAWGAPAYAYVWVQMKVYDTTTYNVIWNIAPVKLRADSSGKTYSIPAMGDCAAMIRVDGWAWRAGFTAASYTPQAHKSVWA